MNNWTKAAAFAAGTMMAGASFASPIPAIDGDYQGAYDLGNVFSQHGLYLPGLLGDNSWSVLSGTATYSAGALSMSGQVEQSYGGSDYLLNFDFQVFETNDHPNGLVCGTSTCNSATQDMRDNLVFFDMGSASIMGTITGVDALTGLEMDVEMRPLDGTGRKPGQLGFGGNWRTLDFGYSNWLKFEVTGEADNSVNGLTANLGQRRNGDINVNFLANDDPGPTPVPLPAGLPLMLAGFAALFGLRRRAS